MDTLFLLHILTLHHFYFEIHQRVIFLQDQFSILLAPFVVVILKFPGTKRTAIGQLSIIKINFNYNFNLKTKSLKVKFIIHCLKMQLLIQSLLCCLLTTTFLETTHGFNPCCSYPCQNNGICMPTGHGVNPEEFECDCTGTGYFGTTCHRATWKQWFVGMIDANQETKLGFITGYPALWSIINTFGYLHSKALTYVYFSRGDLVKTPHLYNINHEYITLDVYYNRSMYARDLPPIPCCCPTAMGVAGPVTLPSAEEIFERVFKRTKFIPDNRGTNLLFATYAQHFTLQFFKTDYKRGDGFTWGDEGVDVSQIYGKDELTRWALRSRLNGKLKTRLLHGEEFPPYLEDAPEVDMFYPPQGEHSGEPSSGRPSHVSPKWAFGHPKFSRSPAAFVMAAIWIREHNRVCDVLLQQHPRWEDERIYQTARLIITGEMIQITLSEYVQHLSQYNIKLGYRPELTHNIQFQYANRIRHEFNYLYHWHFLLPDQIHIKDKSYNLSDIMYTNNALVFEHGFDTWVEAMTNQIAGKMTVRNDGKVTALITKRVITEGRDIRLQPFNNYRIRFGYPAYKTFEELTGEKEVANVLRELYNDIDAVEFYVGMIAEKHNKPVTPPTMIAMGGPWAVKGLMSNPIGSPGWWKPSTFGGEVGFNIIKDATLKKLFCDNMKSKCKGFKIGFSVPEEVLERELKNYDDPGC